MSMATILKDFEPDLGAHNESKSGLFSETGYGSGQDNRFGPDIKFA